LTFLTPGRKIALETKEVFMIRFFGVICGLLLSSAAMAQDYGLTVGIHQTTATVSDSTTTGLAGGSVSGRLGFDAGLTASFELIPQVRFRTGVLYNQRPFDYKLANNVGTVGFNFAYVDVPVNAQYNFNQTVGIYGGLIVGVKASDSVNVPNGGTYSPNMKSLYPLVNGGVNFMFNDMIGFDVYYEMGLGEFADNLKNYSTFGMHFIYWL
jgi:hypothetical protein